MSKYPKKNQSKFHLNRIRAFFVNVNEGMRTHSKANRFSRYFDGIWFCMLFLISLPLRYYVAVPIALIAAGTVAICVEYLTIAKPKISFLIFFTTIEAILVLASATLYWFSSEIQHSVAVIWIGAFCIALPFNNNKDKREDLWKYLLGSFVGALLLILIASGLSRVQ